nr:unnamed protein product [Digitaria exilis]
MDVEGPGDNRDRLPGVVAMGHHFKPCPCNVLDGKRPRSRVLAEPAKVDHGQWRPRRRRLPQLHNLARHGSSPTAHAEQNKCALPNALLFVEVQAFAVKQCYCCRPLCKPLFPGQIPWRLLRVEDWVQEQATQQPQACRQIVSVPFAWLGQWSPAVAIFLLFPRQVAPGTYIPLACSRANSSQEGLTQSEPPAVVTATLQNTPFSPSTRQKKIMACSSPPLVSVASSSSWPPPLLPPAVQRITPWRTGDAARQRGRGRGHMAAQREWMNEL